jgi:hypothetical protein
MPASPDATPRAALERELVAIADHERAIRRLHAKQYRRIQGAREFAAVVEGVTATSTPSDRDMATRSFVAEVATTLGQHEASASRLIGEADRLPSDPLLSFEDEWQSLLDQYEPVPF